MTEPAVLAAARRASVSAPAGCGKTHLISKAVSKTGALKDLVLTHTHAGVDALRRKMRTLAISAETCSIDTIAGWALRYATSFPQSSGMLNPVPKTRQEWDSVYLAAQSLLGRPAIRDVIRATYAGVFVDEYQDCTIQQHQLVLALADILPTRVLGDPLQGIFDFGQNQPVDWARDVLANFAELPPLAQPWRWEGRNPALGRWLAGVRVDLLNRRPIELAGAPITWERIQPPSQVVAQVRASLSVSGQNGHTVVAIHGMPQQCHFVASRLNGLYQCIEPIESGDLFQGGQRIQDSIGPARVVAVIDFAGKCLTRVRTALQRVRTSYAAGNIPQTRQGQLTRVFDALRALSASNSYSDAAAALELIRTIPQAVLYRRELFDEMLRGLRTAVAGDGSLTDALWVVRSRTRFSGRRLARCSVGTTLLVKGLEFDHAIILDADGMEAKDLYVALTRGARSLTIFSRQQRLTPTYS